MGKSLVLARKREYVPIPQEKRRVLYWSIVSAIASVLGAATLADAQTTLATGLNGPSYLQLYGGNLYFADTVSTPNDTLMDVSANGGTPTTLFTGLARLDTQYNGINAYTIDGSKIYGGYGDYDDYTVFAGSSLGGTTTPLATPTGGYFIGEVNGTAYYGSGFNNIDAVPSTGGPSTPVASGVFVRSVATDSSGAYFQSFTNTSIYSFNYAAKSLSVRLSSAPQNSVVFVDTSNVYLSLPSGGIETIPKTGGSLKTVVSGSGITGYAAANGNVFYTQGNTIEQASVSGGSAISLATVPTGTVSSMTTDGNWLYYAVGNGGAGTINKVPVGIATIPTTQPPAPGLTNPYRPSPANLLVFNAAAGKGGAFQSGLNINLNLPIVVLTLGWKETVAEWPTAMAQELGPGAGSKFNVVAWDWSTDADVTRDNLPGAYNLPYSASRTQNDGAALGFDLETTLGASYTQSLHFIGHSLGTLVNAEAIDVFQNHNSIAPIQDTLLDEASIAYQAAGTSPDYQVNPVPKPGDTVSTENYISSFGTLHDGATNIILQNDPSNTLSKTDKNYWINFHNYPIQWYGSTILTPSLSLLGYTGAIENGNVSGPAYQSNTYYLQGTNPSTEFTLTPTTLDSAAQVLKTRNNQELSFLNGLNGADNLAAEYTTNVSISQLIGAIKYENNVLVSMQGVQSGAQSIMTPKITFTKEPNASVAAIQQNASASISSSDAIAPTSSSYTWIPIAVPSDVQYLSLDFTFSSLSPGDLLSIGVDDSPIFQLEDQFATDGVAENTGLLDISQWAGQNVQLFVGLVAADDNDAGGTITIANLSFSSVPEPAMGSLILIGMFAVARRSRFRSRSAACQFVV